MPRLTAATLTYGSTIEVRFTTNRDLPLACETAVLQLADAGRGGSELGIRFERGGVVDVYLWDAGRRLRQRMPVTNVTVDGVTITCVIPMAVVPADIASPRLEAALVVNGAAVQSRFPVTLMSRMQAQTEQAQRLISA